MKLESVSVKNFRCYKSITLDLHPQLTVLVANNGGGKTTLLDAIRIGLWPYLKGFDLAYTAQANAHNRIDISDILLLKSGQEMARQLPTEVITKGDYGDSTKQWIVYKNKETKGSKNITDTSGTAINKFAQQQQEQIRHLNEPPINLPVFGYYGTGRLWNNKKKKSIDESSSNIRTFAYDDCLNPASSYKQFKEWFTDKSIQELESQISQLKANKNSFEIEPEIENPILVVRKAVDVLLKGTGWKNLHYSQKDNKSLVLDHNDIGTLNVDLMSDGIKKMVAMVADIAYRCSLLNAHLGVNAALKSNGVVMIDEVDMHLHPKWQQTVVSGLTEAFPNIQFIVTTHSPQVLSTVSSDSIRLLKQGTSSETGEHYSLAEMPDIQSRGVASSDVLATLMDIDPVPEVVEAKWLNEYRALIQQNEHDTEHGNALWTKLVLHFGEQHQELLECGRLIRLVKMKTKLKESLIKS